MNIGVHLATLRGFGSSVVGRNVLREFASQTCADRVHVWVPSQWVFDEPGLAPHITVHRSPPGLHNKFWLENVSLRREIVRNRFDCLFSMGDTSIAYCGIPHLLLVQQAYLAHRREDLDFELPSRFAWKLRFMEVYFQLALPSITHFTVQTSEMKQSLCARWSIAPERVSIVPSSSNISPAPIDIGARSTAVLAARHRYVCYVASAGAHKNFEVLADMLDALPPELADVRCHLTVRPADVPNLVARARKLGVLERFEFLGGIDGTRVRALIDGALALVMPSKLESFGLPYYEAMARACPVIAARRGFALEACGEAALYAPADDGRAFANALTQLLETDRFYRDMSVLSYERAAQANRPWTAIAAAYLELLRTISKG